MSTLTVSLDGYTDLPPGKIANVVTYLEITEPPKAPPPPSAGLSVNVVQRPAADWYRALYRRIGENWLWTSRAVMRDAELATLLARPTTTIMTLEKDGAEIGLVELDTSAGGAVEIVTFGVVPEAVGTGAAKVMMAETLKQVFRGATGRVWLHTCTLDHPGAIRFYRRQGFRPYKLAIEICDDPRLSGHLPITAAPQVPLISGK